MITFTDVKPVSYLSSNGFSISLPLNLKENILKILGFNSSLKIVELTSFSNKNYHIINPDLNQEFVLRIPSEMSNLFSVRSEERKNLDSAYVLGYSPLVVRYFDEMTGIMITEFIKDCKSCNSSTFHKLELQKKAMNHLRSIHHSKLPFHNLFDRWQRLKKMKELLGQVPMNRALGLYEKVRENDEHILESQFDRFPCHNDPSPENFILRFDEIQTIDWEASALNDPMWDLAHFSAILSLSEQKESELIHFYNPKDLTLAKAKICYFKPFIHLASALWALHHLETKNFIFPENVLRKIYDDRCQYIEDLFQQPCYHQSLEILSNKLCR